MNLIIFGPQGSGKGTYASRLSPILKIPHISIGDLVRNEMALKTPIGKKIEKIVNAGILISDEIATHLLQERLKKPDCKNGFILDGFPRTTEQVEALERITKIDTMINLVVPEWILLERLSGRVLCKKCGTIYNVKTLKPKKEGVCDKCGGTLIQRADETPESIKQRLKMYREQSEPLIEYYRKKGLVVDVECNQLDIPPEEMVGKILSELKKIRLVK